MRPRGGDKLDASWEQEEDKAGLELGEWNGFSGLLFHLSKQTRWDTRKAISPFLFWAVSYT